MQRQSAVAGFFHSFFESGFHSFFDKMHHCGDDPNYSISMDGSDPSYNDRCVLYIGHWGDDECCEIQKASVIVQAVDDYTCYAW